MQAIGQFLGLSQTNEHESLDMDSMSSKDLQNLYQQLVLQALSQQQAAQKQPQAPSISGRAKKIVGDVAGWSAVLGIFYVACRFGLPALDYGLKNFEKVAPGVFQGPIQGVLEFSEIMQYASSIVYGLRPPAWVVNWTPTLVFTTIGTYTAKTATSVAKEWGIVDGAKATVSATASFLAHILKRSSHFGPQR